MRVGVTGAAGMIGSNLIQGLNGIGIDEIIAVDDLTAGMKYRNLLGAKLADYFDRDEFYGRFERGELVEGGGRCHGPDVGRELGGERRWPVKLDGDLPAGGGRLGQPGAERKRGLVGQQPAAQEANQDRGVHFVRFEQPHHPASEQRVRDVPAGQHSEGRPHHDRFLVAEQADHAPEHIRRQVPALQQLQRAHHHRRAAVPEQAADPVQHVLGEVAAAQHGVGPADDRGVPSLQ